MESESEDAGHSHTGPLSRGLYSSRKSVGRSLTLRPQRVPVSSICDDNHSGDEDGQGDTATPSNSSATIGTVSAILAANRRLERNPSGDPPPSDSCPDKENGWRGVTHPYDLLTPLPRRTGSVAPASQAPAGGRTPRQPLSRIDTPARPEQYTVPPTAASAVKRPFVFGEPSAEKRPPMLSHASRSHSLLPPAERPTPGLSRGLSEGRLQGVGIPRRSLPVVAERPADGTPPEQRTAPLNQSGSAPAPGPTARVSPAEAARVSAEAARFTAAAPHEDHRRGYVTPYRHAPGVQAAAARQAEALGCVSGAAQTHAVPAVSAVSDSRTGHPHTLSNPAPYRVGQGGSGGGGGGVPPVSRYDSVDSVTQRLTERQEPASSLSHHLPARPTTTFAGGTIGQPAAINNQYTTASIQQTSAAAAAGTLSRTGEVRQTSFQTSVSSFQTSVSSLQTSVSSSSAVQSRLGAGSMELGCSTAVSATNGYSSSSSGHGLPVPSAVPSVPSAASSVLSASSALSATSSSLSAASHSAFSAAPSAFSAAPSAFSAAPSAFSAVPPALSAAPSLFSVAPSALNASPPVPAALPNHVHPSPPPSRPLYAECATQTDESDSAAMPPPPTELFFGKRQLRTLTVNQRDYIVMKQIGRGGSSKVYQVFDGEMRSLAIKQVFLENTDDATASGYRNEIALLHSLQHSDRVVRLIDYEHRASDQMIYIVMEKGDTDLTTLLRSYVKLNEVDANMCKFFWGEMLRCVDVIHRENIVHSDLKPSNFLMVGGRLKLIDFGIASQIQSDCTSIIKDSQVGTFNYMSPEAIEAQQVTRNGESQTAIKISRRSDVWSLGCILYNLVYGTTPFGHIKQAMGKLMAIVNRRHEIEFPPVSDCHLLAVLRSCLRRDPYQRPSIEELLSDPYLTGCKCQCQK